MIEQTPRSLHCNVHYGQNLQPDIAPFAPSLATLRNFARQQPQVVAGVLSFWLQRESHANIGQPAKGVARG